MSIAFSVTHQYPQPRDHVFAALTDLQSAGRWMPGFIRIEQLTEGPFRVGTEWRETRKLFGRKATEQFEVTGCEPPKHIALRVDGSKGSSRRGEFLFNYNLEPAGKGTEVTLHGEIRNLGLLGGIFGKIFAGPFKKACVRDLKALAEYLARGEKK